MSNYSKLLKNEVAIELAHTVSNMELNTYIQNIKKLEKLKTEGYNTSGWENSICCTDVMTLCDISSYKKKSVESKIPNEKPDEIIYSRCPITTSPIFNEKPELKKEKSFYKKPGKKSEKQVKKMVTSYAVE